LPSSRSKFSRKNLINLAEYVLLRSLLFLLRLLPYPVSRFIATSLVVGIGYGIGIRRKEASRHLERVYPHKSKAERKLILRRLYHNMGLIAAEVYLMPERKLISSSEISGREHIREALAMGRGALLATAHFGNWEAARVLPLSSIAVSVVVRRQRNTYFDRFNTAIREQHGAKVIDMRRGLRDIIAHLSNNEMVAILADQNAGSTGLIMDFLGFPASHWKGVAKLSLRYKVPIIPGFALRTEQGNLCFTFEPMIYHPDLEDNEENYVFILKQINSIIESYIHRYPEQWFWVHRRWKATGAMD